MKLSKCNKLAEMQHKWHWHAEQEHDDLVNEMVNLMA